MTTPLTVLRRLGDNRDQVAINLAALDCRGERSNCLACPVALYLLRSELNPVEVLVGDYEAELTYTSGHKDTVDLPEAVHEFVIGFDHGMYDQLLKPVTA
ncbi:MAG: hypothetical protein ABW046_07100 [Actinoplanes sp.]